MSITSATAPKAFGLPGRGPELPPRARLRLKCMDYCNSHSHNARLTCRYLRISPHTFYRWKRHYNPQRLESLEDRPRRPHRLRQPTASTKLVEALLRPREKYPRWGKDKLVLLLPEESFVVSTPVVGRFLRRPKERAGCWRSPHALLSPRTGGLAPAPTLYASPSSTWPPYPATSSK